MTVLNVRDYGAEGDGQSNDAEAIQRAINDTTDGDTVYLPETDAYYRVEHTGGEPIISIDGDSHGNDITVEGDGPGTVVRVADNVSSSYSVFRVSSPDGFTVRLRNFVIDGNRANTGGVSPGHGITFRETNAAGPGDSMLVEDVEVKNCASSGISIQYGGVNINRCTIHDCRLHGIVVQSDFSGIYDPKPLITQTHCYENGGYEIDFSGGKGVAEECVLENNVGFGAGKVSINAIEFVLRRVRIQNNESRTFTNSSDPGDEVDLTFEDCVFEHNENGFRFAVDTQYTFLGEIVITNNAYNGSTDLYFTEDSSLDATNAHVYINNSQASDDYIAYWSNASSTIDHLSTANNAGSLNIQRDLTINTRDSQVKTDIDVVPTAEEVGAWTENETDGAEDEDEDETSDTTDEETVWTPRWNVDDDSWRIITDPGFTGEHALAFEQAEAERGRYAISWDSVGNPADVEVLDKFRVPRFNDDESLGFHARVHLRSSTSNGRENGYWIEVENRESAFRLAKYTDGQLVTLGHFGTPTENTFFYRRFRAIGQELQAKVWPADENEPDEWNISVVDTDHSEGWVGLGSFDPELVETDIFSVGTNGEPAKIAEENNLPEVSWNTPTDGQTVSGTVTLQISANHIDQADGSLTVDLRIADGEWSTASYNVETGYYEETWDTMDVANDEYSLETRVTDTADNTSSDVISVTVNNHTHVDSIGSKKVTQTAATLVGELTGHGGNKEVTVGFELRVSGKDAWEIVGQQTVSAIGEFTSEIDDLTAGTDYEFRAVADTDDPSVGEVLTFTTTEQDATTLSIDQFDVTDRSSFGWTRFDIDWTVSEVDGNLDTVVSAIEYEGTTVAAKTTSITGEKASYTHVVRVRGDVDKITLSANNIKNETVTLSEEV